MQNGSAITIVKSANGFIVFEQDVVELPRNPKDIFAFTEIGDVYSYNGLISFIKNHFSEPMAEEKNDTE